MKDLDIGVFIAVLQEMLGPWLWVLAALAVIATLACLAVLLRDRGLESRRLVLAELLGLTGGVGAVALMQWVTHSSFADIGGPIDLMVVAGIFAAGFGGAVVGSYALLGMLLRARPAGNSAAL